MKKYKVYLDEGKTHNVECESVLIDDDGMLIMYAGQSDDTGDYAAVFKCWDYIILQEGN